MFAWSVQIICGQDSQNKIQMFTLFSGRHVGVPWRYTSMSTTWRFHTGLPGLGSVDLCKIFWQCRPKTWRSVLFNNLLKYDNFLTLYTEWFQIIFNYVTVQPKNRSWNNAIISHTTFTTKKAPLLIRSGSIFFPISFFVLYFPCQYHLFP